MLAFRLRDGLVNFTWLELAMALICFVLSIAVIPLLLLRRAIIAWPPRWKWALAATAGTLWLLAAGSFVVLIVTGA